MKSTWKKIVITSVLMVTPVIMAGPAEGVPLAAAQDEALASQSNHISSDTLAVQDETVVLERSSPHNSPLVKLVKLINDERSKQPEDLKYAPNQIRRKCIHLEVGMAEAVEEFAEQLKQQLIEEVEEAHGNAEYNSPYNMIVRGKNTPEEIMHAWMSNANNREQILDRELTTVDVARRGNVWIVSFARG